MLADIKTFWRNRGWVGRLVTVIVGGLYFVPILLTVSYFAALTKLSHMLYGRGPSAPGYGMAVVTFSGSLTVAFLSIIWWTYLMAVFLWRWLS